MIKKTYSATMHFPPPEPMQACARCPCTSCDQSSAKFSEASGSSWPALMHHHAVPIFTKDHNLFHVLSISFHFPRSLHVRHQMGWFQKVCSPKAQPGANSRPVLGTSVGNEIPKKMQKIGTQILNTKKNLGKHGETLQSKQIDYW